MRRSCSTHSFPFHRVSAGAGAEPRHHEPDRGGRAGDPGVRGLVVRRVERAVPLAGARTAAAGGRVHEQPQGAQPPHAEHPHGPAQRGRDARAGEQGLQWSSYNLMVRDLCKVDLMGSNVISCCSISSQLKFH